VSHAPTISTSSGPPSRCISPRQSESLSQYSHVSVSTHNVRRSSKPKLQHAGGRRQHAMQDTRGERSTARTAPSGGGSNYALHPSPPPLTPLHSPAGQSPPPCASAWRPVHLPAPLSFPMVGTYPHPLYRPWASARCQGLALAGRVDARDRARELTGDLEAS